MEKKTLPRRYLTRATQTAALCLLLWGGAAARPARADGCFIPDAAYEKLPAIPTQRALLRHDEGVETLIIESSLDAEGQAFGWMIPLPAAPTEFREVSPGLVKTLSFCTRPEITYDLGLYENVTLLFLVAAVTLIAFGAILSRARPPLRWALLLLCVVLLGGVLLLSSLGGALPASALPAPWTPGLRVLETVDVGSYGLTVLEADSADALEQWLKDSGLAALPAEGMRIVSDYVADGWCFVAARLKRDGAGLSTPHPLLMSFPTAQPVYPIRLTAVAGSEVLLEVFVCAEQRAEMAGLGTEFCDSFERRRYFASGNRRFYYARPSHLPTMYYGSESGRSIAHAGAEGLFGPGCVLTRLTGRLGPGDMRDDIRVGLIPFSPCRRRVWSSPGACQSGLGVAMAVWCVGLVAGIAVKLKRIRAPGGRSYAVRYIVLPLLGLCAVILAGTYAVLPKVHVRAEEAPRVWYHNLMVEGAAQALMNEHPELLDAAPAELERALTEGLRQIKNPFTGQPVEAEDSPGNFALQVEPEPALWVFEQDGSPYVIPLRPPSGPQ